jgi:hypothetical protein
MAERRVNFIESSPHDNPIKFEIMPLPDKEFLHVFYEVIEKNPHNEFGAAEIQPDGVSYKALVWDRSYTVVKGDDCMKIANKVYNLEQYSENHWRNIANANDIDPITFEQDFLGKEIKIPAIIPHEIIQGYVKDWVEKSDVELK